jgi:hypothetical protein
MYRDREQMRQRLQEIIQKFREKGATSPEKAMTIQELGLPPRFEQAMHRRLGQTGIFVEVNGKYYLNEDRLKQIQEQRAQRRVAGGSGYNREGPPGWLSYGGILLILPIGIIVFGFLLFYFFVYNRSGYFPSEILIILLVVLLVMFVVRMLFWRARRKYWRERWTQNRAPYGQQIKGLRSPSS